MGANSSEEHICSSTAHEQGGVVRVGQYWERKTGMRRVGFKEIEGREKRKWGMIGKGEKGDKCRNKSGGQKIYNTGQYTGNAGVWSENGCSMQLQIIQANNCANVDTQH